MTTPNAPKAAAPAVAEALQLALNEERLKFQRETLRTSMMAAVLRGFIEKLQPEHEIGAWSRGCDLCVLVSEADALLKRPINAGPDIAAAPQQVAEPEQVTVTVDRMVESVNGVSRWVVLRRGKHRQDDGKYGAAFRNRAEWHAAGLRWILGQADKPNIHDFMDAAPTSSAPPSQASATGEV